ncbi:MAG: DUF4118 domain-containing protein [Eubacterium sp.]|nr:DUF4118 domain-containing protein [Eubacterium sp.]
MSAITKPEHYRTILLDICKSIGFLSAATLLGLAFDKLGFTNANIIMVYILGALLTSIATSHQIYSLVSSVAGVFVFNYLFTEPRYTLMAHETGYPVTFLVMFITAYITGSFSIRYKRQARQSARNARLTRILFDTSQLLSKANDKDEIIETTVEQIVKLLNRTLVLFEYEEDTSPKPLLFQSDQNHIRSFNRNVEMPAVEWVYKNKETIVQAQDRFPGLNYSYYTIHMNERIYGVIGIYTEAAPLDASEHEILLSILGECALALENERNAREKEAAAILAENEQLRANLLRTISHDLRTPLTTISGNASNLLSNGSCFDEETRQQIYLDIYNDSMWLYDLVENLLYSTRIEEGRMVLHTSAELLSDIIEDAVNHFVRKTKDHRIIIDNKDELLLIRADAKLLEQVIINIIDNAIKYTPQGTEIHITTEKADDMAKIRIADNGSGIPDAEKDKIFDKFYHGANKIADNRRSIGLGLYLCKAIVEAHGGTIHVIDNKPTGSVFRFTVPLEEAIQYE